MRRSVLTLLSLGALFATPAMAETTTVHIPVAASDLESPEAVSALYQRVVVAADNVCVASGTSPLLGRGSCREETVETAVEKANITALSAQHENATTITIATSSTGE